MVKLYELVKDEGGALRTLDAAAAAMEAEKSKDAAVHAKRFRMLAADMRLSSQDSDQALSALEAKVAQGDKDQTNLARLVSLLCAKGEVDKADKYAAMLPALAEAEDVDVQVLDVHASGQGSVCKPLLLRRRNFCRMFCMSEKEHSDDMRNDKH